MLIFPSLCLFKYFSFTLIIISSWLSLSYFHSVFIFTSQCFFFPTLSFSFVATLVSLRWRMGLLLQLHLEEDQLLASLLTHHCTASRALLLLCFREAGYFFPFISFFFCVCVKPLGCIAVLLQYE